MGENVTAGSEADFARGLEPSGVPNLDLVMGGGVPHGALMVIIGAPGSGKTTLASQIAFNAARAGKSVLILTALSESTSKLVQHLGAFSFFDPELIGSAIQFLSLQHVMAQGFVATRDEVLRMARQIKAQLLVIDGFRSLRDIEPNPTGARQFLYDVGTALGTLGTPTIVTSEAEPRDPALYPEATTADVILGLHYDLHGGRQGRALEVVKARGIAPLPGVHTLTLDADGAHVYPQFEERVGATIGDQEEQDAAIARNETSGEQPRRANFDLPELDGMLEGGFARGTSVVLAGSLGTGKTLLALHFALAGISTGEPAIYLSFRERKQDLSRLARPFALNSTMTSALAAENGLTLVSIPPNQIEPDIVADRLLELLYQAGARRLVIDSIDELTRVIARSRYPERLDDYLIALVQACRAQNVTMLVTKETTKSAAATLDFSSRPLSVMAENVLLLQQATYRARQHHVLAAL
ncbi:MAG TPA: ATPase domain-containing protein, partial [Ktedonobacterales bacterium]|nr:ATPase domain-containing protein [Ktedonobacterales bacterium]